MWRCENCGANVQSGTICPACGRLSDEALNEISQKVRRVRLRRFSAARWLWRVAKTGFAVGSGLSLILAAGIVITNLVRYPVLSEMGAVLGVFLSLFVVVALFWSVKRFEEKYGSSRNERGERER